MPALQRPHVLIISDDRGLTDFLGEGLVYAGFWTSVIASAMQTLEVFRLRSFDLMVLDAELGGFGAVELVRRLRGHSDRASEFGRTDIPILAISSIAGGEVETLLTAGVDRVLAPPIELDGLALAIDAVLREWRASHPDRPWADAAQLGSPTTR